MKKNWFVLLPIICVMIMTAVHVCAADAPRFVDYAGLITDMDEEYAIFEALDNISATYSCDVVIVTTDSLDGKTAQEYANDYYDLVGGYGYGDDYTGIIFLISMAEREWAISTCGGAISVFTDSVLMSMEDAIIPYLSSGDYAEAFMTYADLCEDTLSRYAQGGSEEYNGYNPYDPYIDPYYSDYYYDDPYGQRTERGVSAMWIPGSVLIAFVLSLIVVNTMKGEMNSVHMQSGAATYEKQNSFRLTEQRDLFLYRNVSRTLRQTEQNRSSHGGGHSSVHRSSSGRSHGGRSGRF